MSVVNRARPKKTLRSCNYCGNNVWNKTRSKKHGCCTKFCKESLEILTGRRVHPLSEELKLKYARYGGSFYTTVRWLNLRHLVLKRDGSACAKCGSTRNPNIDHVVPVSWCQGGYWSPSNLQVLCGVCNRSKGASNSINWRDRNAVTSPT